MNFGSRDRFEIKKILYNVNSDVTRIGVLESILINEFKFNQSRAFFLISSKLELTKIHTHLIVWGS